MEVASREIQSYIEHALHVGGIVRVGENGRSREMPSAYSSFEMMMRRRQEWSAAAILFDELRETKETRFD
jgi:hypothetical protein